MVNKGLWSQIKVVFRFASQLDLNGLCFDNLKFAGGCVFYVFPLLLCDWEKKTQNQLTLSHSRLTGDSCKRASLLKIHFGISATTFICVNYISVLKFT